MEGIKQWLVKKLLTKSFWDRYAVLYDQIEYLLSYQHLQDRVLDHLELIPHLRILDVGCGTGNTLVRIERNALWHTELFGVDRSPLMLERARKKLQPEADIREHDLNIPLDLRDFGGIPFDRLVSVNSLYAVEDPARVLRSWYSLLDDGGILVLANPCRPKIRTWLGEHLVMAIRRADLRALWNTVRLTRFVLSNVLIKWGAQGRVMHFLPPLDLKKLAQEAGFTILVEEYAYRKGVVILQLQKDLKSPMRRAHTYQEIAKLGAIRYEVYCNEIKSLDAKEYPDGVEFDKYDDCAISFFVRKQGEYVGSIRLISYCQDTFLMEEAVAFPDSLKGERERTLEVSRWIVIPKARGTGVWYTLVEEAVRWSSQRGYIHWIAACRDKLWAGLQKHGWKVVLWEDYKEYHHTLAAPGELIPPPTAYATLRYHRSDTPSHGLRS